MRRLFASFVLLAAACGATPAGGADAAAEGAASTPDGRADTMADAPADGAADPCLPDASPGHHVVTCEGLTVDVEIPASCPQAGCGLILEIHGLFMNADVMDANTNLRALGRARGYVVVQPTAPSGRLPQGPAWLDADDDAVWAVLEHVRAATRPDAQKIHVTGFSQGGFMTWRLLCKHSDVLASAAPGAAGSGYCPAGSLNGSCDFGKLAPKPLSVLFVAGLYDSLVPLACARAERDAAIAAWSLGAPQSVAGDATFTRVRYPGTTTALEVIEHAYTTDPASALASNAGHCVPGANAMTGTVWDALKCKPPNSFVWGDEVMAFFVAHPKP